MLDGEDNDDDGRPFPSPMERTWVHPAEAAAALEATQTPSPRRITAGMLVASAGLGALAMFTALAATGMISGFGDGGETAVVRPTTLAAASTEPPATDTMVSVRIDGENSLIHSSGLVVDGKGNIVTPATGLDAGAGVEVTVYTDDQAWSEVEIVGIDTATDLAVLSVGQHQALRVTAVAEPAMGSVSLVPGGSDHTAGEAYVADTNETVTMGGRSLMGTVVIATDSPQIAGALVVDSGGSAVALATHVDDDPADRLVYATPAQTAVRVAHDIIRHGRSHQVSLGVEIAVGTTGDGRGGVEIAAVTAGGPAERAGVEAGDAVMSIDQCPTPDLSHLFGCLLRYNDRDTVALTLERSGQPLAADATLTDLDVL